MMSPSGLIHIMRRGGVPVKCLLLLLLLYFALQIFRELLIKLRTSETIIALPMRKEPLTVEEEMRLRRIRLNSQCDAIKPKTSYPYLCAQIQEDPELQLSWCNVPKAGSTVWRKIFYILPLSVNGVVSLSFDAIGFRDVHKAPLKNVCAYKTPEAVASHVTSQKSFLVARDPYSRLFSAYIDKFYLPDHWSTVGVHIVTHFRKNFTAKSQHCGHDVTFQEFIKYVIHVAETGNGSKWFHDNHWLPVSKICLPCQVSYSYISKEETFSRDLSFLLDEFKIRKYVDTSISKGRNAARTISQKIEAYWVTGLRAGCLSEHRLMQRLWTAFQIQGYLPFHETFRSNVPVTLFRVHNRKTFTKAVLRVQRQYDNTNLKKQRLQARKKAYATLSLVELRSIQRLFDLDFALFGYEREPKELFY